MICSKCKNKISSPLYLFNGQTTCPICKNELLSFESLYITQENEELYKLSKIALSRYLSPNSCAVEKAGKTDLTASELLDRAIDFCSQSARQGNPKAIYQLGYIYEYFSQKNKSKVERIKSAFEFYACICYNDSNSIKIDKNADVFSDKEFYDLKITASKSLLRIASQYSSILSSSNRYDYETNKNRLISIYGNDLFEEQLLRDDGASNVETIFNALLSTRSKTRAPLFGSFLLSASEVKALFEMVDASTNLSVRKLVKKSPDFLRYTICDIDGRYGNDDVYYDRVANENRIDDLLNTVEDKNYVYFFFFNSFGKHQYLNGRQMQKVKKYLEENDQTLLKKITQTVTERINVFYDDDVKQFMTGKNIKYSTIEQIVDFICSNK